MDKLKTIIKIFKNKHFKYKLSDEDMKCFKIILKHLFHKDSSILYDPSTSGYIISNDNTHYYLLISVDKIQLVNTDDILLLHISSIVRDRVFLIIKDLLKKQREELRQVLLGRKSNVLDKVLTNLRK
jgi:hypothetical protein